MKDVSVVSAVEFGFKTFFKKILFFLWASIVTFFVWFAGFIASTLIAAPFFIPMFKIAKKIKMAYMAISQVEPMSATGAQAAAQIKANAAKIFDFIVDIVSKYPLAFVFAILGVVVFFAALLFVVAMLQLGWIRISLEVKDKGSSSLSALFSKPGLIFRAFLINFCMFFAFGIVWFLSLFLFKFHVVLGGLAAIIAAGITVYLILKWAFVYFVLVDKNVCAIEALKTSFNLKGGPLRIFLLILLFMALGMLVSFILAAFSSIVFAKPMIALLDMFIRFSFSVVVYLSLAYLYRGLLKRNEIR